MLEHMKLPGQHKLNESMHAEIVHVRHVTLAVSQIFLVEWKKRYYWLFLFSILIDMWIIPLLLRSRGQ
jgi:hypothetical protein